MDCHLLLPQAKQPFKGNALFTQSAGEKKTPVYLNFSTYLNSFICSTSERKRGFGAQPVKKGKVSRLDVPKEDKDVSSQPRKLSSGQSETSVSQAPKLSSSDGRRSESIVFDSKFNEKLEAVRRTALEQKKAKDNTQYRAIDYDAPIEPEKSSTGLGVKIGVGAAVVSLGLVFTLGDFLPSGSISTSSDFSMESKKLPEEEEKVLKARLQQYEVALKSSPVDKDALEGAAVTLVELGDYDRAASLLEKLTKEKQKDPDAYRLLGEVKYELKDYSGSVAAYRNSLSLSGMDNFEVLRGLVNALLAAEKPDEAVQVLLDVREQLNVESGRRPDVFAETAGSDVQNVDPIQIDLLLGKAYSNWGHVSDAVSVYDQIISAYPDDFRGYLAKGIILKENGKVGDAERMFIQARFFAPDKAKALVDQYSRR
ncbi:uncharacterized protein LOC116250514 [Nymphaea colorata]|nr:uncharacterized protein LOC116250514 [Nymphaea colorata]